ncbi:hypothetical protein F5B22DRAFT_555619 [Xylaria bambusicola]|uniref:uncharacterized protein n=1 Tax=Xylaria bambusicola TaxID=326684 RepID=UPI0020084991|nr:uncharacterized protein F5B22DRAFT_555619 [Xylaria bambusicola]KAI0503274.1 hypothetical protein F5B22DRAFT_555619 [Xylaria bambusicola]
MSIQKLATAVASLSQETSIGLVNFNFDFALKKYEAPREFQVLGRELSQARIKAAEDGPVHITARKLGALFRQCLPSTPNLIKAYGTRASDVASDPKVNPKPSKNHGILADHVGIDGTSIWAAATSGAESIAVHLLACMLARMWSRSEAIAIWAELVAERKKELEQTDEADPQYQMARNDSRIDITRDQLAQWDSSARAWLQSADEAMKIKQTQLMLILNNINLPVNTKPKLYRNVLQAWTTAMMAADNLIRGVPQSVEYGAILLGISSWHIYPDMLVLQSSPTPVSQADPLVNDAGILTIGLNTDGRSETGISWSLPLGHLRYYGAPVMTEKSLVTQGNRITVTQLIQLSIGCMTRQWALPESDIVRFLVDLWRFVEPVAQRPADGTTFWLGYLAEAVKPLLDQESLEAQVGFRLLKLGARRCSHFLGSDNRKPTTIPRLFGLDDMNVFSSLVARPEDSVPYFRELAKHPIFKDVHTRLCIIRYRQDYEAAKLRSTYEYATVLPLQREGIKRSHDGQQRMVLNPARHCRWIGIELEEDSSEGRYVSDRLEHFTSQGEDSFSFTDGFSKTTPGQMKWTGSREEFARYGISQHIGGNIIGSVNGLAPEDTYSYSEFIDFEAGLDIYDNSQTRSLARITGLCNITFEVVLGSLDTVALMVSKRYPDEDLSMFKPTIGLSLSTFLEAMRSKNSPVSRKETLSHLCKLVNMPAPNLLDRSLRVLATVSSIYNQLPSSTISLSVIENCLPEMAWIPSTGASTGEYSPFTQNSPTTPFKLDRSSTFSCLLLFETGSLSVPPNALQEVMAMAISDSIYIAKILISDPSDKCFAHEIVQVRGSIGRSGIALMIPPKSPLTRKMDLSNWHLVNHNTFDGQLHDSFSSTTLHLGFTDYIFPVHVGNHGNRDFEVYFLESLVSVHDRGEWVADLDILRALEEDVSWKVVETNHWKQPLFSSISKCDHTKGHEEDSERVFLTTIDDWNEIFDPPGSVAIVRSLNNWLGRLATAAVCRQLGNLVIVLPGKFCKLCLSAEWTRLSTPPKPSGNPEQTGPSFVYVQPSTIYGRPHLELEPDVLLQVMVNGVSELRKPDYVRDNMMSQGNIFLIC